MRTCHACHAELDLRAVQAGNCPHCGAVLRKLSPRTIDDTRLRDDNGNIKGTTDSDDSIDLEPGDTDQGVGATIELSNFFDLDKYREEHPSVGQSLEDRAQERPTDDDQPTPPLPTPTSRDAAQTIDSIQSYDLGPLPTPNTSTPAPPEPPKNPTVDYRADRTMEFQTLPSVSEPGASATGAEPTGVEPAAEATFIRPTRRSTHSLESDKTIDLSMSPSEVRQLDSQWRDTIDPEAKQGQTIRARETLTSGFRSSLPVKSRYVRERRKAGFPPPRSASEVPDYELLDIIGEGGMGVVYAAHQSSIARTVAVKMLKPSAKIREEQRDKFISEAVVTGELDHPNIVPIYDLGSNEGGALFYSMKRVRGTPWDKVIQQKQIDENLSILLRVADAVAFAHAGGVIHRDLKPENVMLGDYGEVLVMDWGLARITPEFAHVDTVYQSDSLGGTPAYMAPEMAKGPVETINKTSDVYLLGAILYEIIGGNPPHSGRDVMQCLMAASQNRIDPIRYDGELKEIALRAMATQQADRYQTVKEFQEAIRLYQSHSESLVLSAHASQNLQKARAENDYQLFARALYGFQESLALWSENHRAKRLLTETQRDYATSALAKGDLDLAASLLNAKEREHEPLLKKIDSARTERNARQRRLRLAKQAVAASLVGIIATISVAYLQVSRARDTAIEQKLIAEDARSKEAEQRQAAELAQQKEAEQRHLAEDAKAKEEQQKLAAIAAEKEASTQRDKAQTEEKKALAAKRAEEYEAYIAQIGLANAKINDNAYDYAQQLLDGAQPELRNWEWGRLTHLCQLGTASYKAAGPVNAVAYSPDGKSIAAGDLAGKVTVRDAQTGALRFEVPHGQYVLAVAYSPNGKQLATGSSDKTIQILDATSGKPLRTLKGHSDGVLSVRFSPDGRQLVSGSYDNTARIWDIATGAELQTLRGHSWWVWAAEFSPNGNRLVTASQDGKAIVWQRRGGARNEERGTNGQELTAAASPFTDDALPTPRSPLPAPSFTQLNEFTGHNGAVYTARFSPKGDLVATGGYDKFVMVWNSDEVRPTDIGRRLDGQPDAKPNYLRLAGHDGPVRSVAFSPNSQLLTSGSEDNSIRVWDIAAGEAVKSLRGHGSAVRSCAFSPDGQFVLSGGDDESVRLWNVAGYQEVRVLHANVFAGHDDAVLSARFSRDGKQIITASRDRTACLWNAATAQPIQHFQEGHDFLVSGVVFYRDGKHLATGAGDNSVRVWDLTAGTQTAVLTQTGRIGTLAVSPDSQWLATGSMGTAVRLWNATTGEPRGSLTGHAAEISALRFSPNGELLATGDTRGNLRLWRLERGLSPFAESAEQKGTVPLAEQGAPRARRGSPDPTSAGRGSPDPAHPTTAGLQNHPGLSAGRGSPDPAHPTTAGLQNHPGPSPHWVLDRDLVGHNGAISGIEFTPDGQRLITASGDHTCAQWNVATGQEDRQLALKHVEYVSSLDLSIDGKLALTTCDDGSARLWRLADGQVVASVKSPGRPFNSASFSPDGSLAVLASSEDKLVRIWNLSPAEAAATRGSSASSASPDPAASAGRGSPDGAGRGSPDPADGAGSGSPDPADGAGRGSPDPAHPTTAGLPQSTDLLLDFNKLGGEVWSAMFAPDGRHILTIGGNEAEMWDLASRRPVIRYSPHGAVASATVSPDGKLAATGSWDHSAKIWDIATGHAVRKLDGGHAGYINSVAFSPDGAELLTASDDGTARLWNVATGKPTGIIFHGHAARLLEASFSPDGKQVLTVSADKTARLWDRATGEPLGQPFAGHGWAVLCGEFSADGRRIITGSQDKTAIIWDAATGQKLVTLEGHTAAITAVAFSPDGTRALTGSQDNTAKLWDPASGKEILSLPGHTQEVTSVSFSPTGRDVLTSSRDGTAIIWLAKDWRKQ